MPWPQFGISYRNNLSYFLSTSQPDASYQVSSQLALQFRRRRENRFSRWPPSWISDRNNFSYFNIFKSSRCFLPIFKSTGPLVQENKRKKVSRWPPWWPSWISDPNNLSYFRSSSHPNASYQASIQMAFQFRRRSEK